MKDQSPVRRIKFPSLWLIAMGHLLLGIFPTFQCSAQTEVKPLKKEVRRVLIFNEIGPWSPAISAMNKGIFAALEKSPYQVELYVEHLETSLFSDEASQNQFRAWYFRKYQNRKPNLIIAIGPSPTKFMADSHGLFAPGTPVVFWQNSEAIAVPPKFDAEFTGVWGVAHPAKTLEAALRLQPGTKHVVVDGGTSPYDRQTMDLVKSRLREFESKLDITYLTDLSMPDLLERMKHLPSDTAVLHVSLLQDAAGRRFIDATQSAPMIAGAANAPVFVMDDLSTYGGAVGGYVYSNALAGQTLGEMAVRILNGEKPQNIPIVSSENIYMFDWRALKRWGLKESNLPPGSTILNREPTIWEAYRPYIFGGVSLIIVEAILIFGLLWHRARLKLAKTELASAFETTQESEQRFRLVANTAPVMIWMSGPDKQCNYFNQLWLEFTGRTIEAELGNGWAEGVHPEDLLVCLSTYEGAFDRRESFQMHYRLRRYDREYRWVFDLGVPRFNADNSFAGYIGSCLDVTDRKLAEEALAGIGRKLIEAHEEERTWIARELHDDVCQRIALLAVELEQWEQRLPEYGVKIDGEIRHIHQELSDLGKDVQAISHRLHSSKLDYLGIVAAARSFCKELSEQQKVEIEFNHFGVSDSLPKEVSLCLFRVLQEALQNAVKHSGERHFRVELNGISGEIQLTVNDMGVGFDQDDAMNRNGLGLISMRERLRLVSGEFSIKSKPGTGTTISACVPLKAEERYASGAG